jgi:hypothetical protein
MRSQGPGRLAGSSRASTRLIEPSGFARSAAWARRSAEMEPEGKDQPAAAAAQAPAFKAPAPVQAKGSDEPKQAPSFKAPGARRRRAIALMRLHHLRATLAPAERRLPLGASAIPTSNPCRADARAKAAAMAAAAAQRVTPGQREQAIAAAVGSRNCPPGQAALLRARRATAQLRRSSPLGTSARQCGLCTGSPPGLAPHRPLPLGAAAAGDRDAGAARHHHL